MAQIMRRISNSLNGARDLISSAGGNLKKRKIVFILFNMFMENSARMMYLYIKETKKYESLNINAAHMVFL